MYPGRYDADYGLDRRELDAFMDAFARCRQHVTYECRGGNRILEDEGVFLVWFLKNEVFVL